MEDPDGVIHNTIEYAYDAILVLAARLMSDSQTIRDFDNYCDELEAERDALKKKYKEVTKRMNEMVSSFRRNP